MLVSLFVAINFLSWYVLQKRILGVEMFNQKSCMGKANEKYEVWVKVTSTNLLQDLTTPLLISRSSPSDWENKLDKYPTHTGAMPK